MGLDKMVKAMAMRMGAIMVKSFLTTNALIARAIYA